MQLLQKCLAHQYSHSFEVFIWDVERKSIINLLLTLSYFQFIEVNEAINKYLGLKIVNMVYSLSRSQTNAKCDKLFFGQFEHGRFDDVLSKHKF